MNRDDLRKVAAELNIPGRSKMTKDERSDAIFEHPNNPLTVNRHGDVTDPRTHVPVINADEFPSVESAHRVIERADVPPMGQRRIVRMIRASQSRRYGQGYRGLGAKHFSSGLDPYTGHTLPFGKVVSDDAVKPLSYGDRVRHYAKQNGQSTATADGMPGPVLTDRQWRRLNKKDNRLKFGPSHATKDRRYA